MAMDFLNLPSNHFLAQPRPDPLLPQQGYVDTTTLAAHDFDVDNRTGFMPPQPPLRRLPSTWEIWESNLDIAMFQKLQLAERVEKMEPQQMLAEATKSRVWRTGISQMPILSTEELKQSERALRRAHHVLTWLLHFYVHTIPSCEAIIIPRPLTLPLLYVSTQLQLPPVVTYSDDVLYNWSHKEARDGELYYDAIPTIHNLRCQTTFTGTTDEEEFYLTSARIELRGNEALELMRLSMDEAFVGDDIAIQRITGYLNRMAAVIQELTCLLFNVKEGVDPHVFYNEIRPWFRGADGDLWGRPWVFVGRDEVEGWTEMPEVSGVSAGQSSLIQALDIYLGVHPESAETSFMPHSSNKSFQERMRAYMPRHHRGFLNHLRANPRPLRAFVQRSAEDHCEVLEAYNIALQSFKEFRDAHITVVALYIMEPARRSRKFDPQPEILETTDVQDGTRKEWTMERPSAIPNEGATLKGTGGTDLVKFLKGVRDQTVKAYLPQ